ncbi:MAG: PAS domain S-box protein [Magnetococcales bacterium]|nr:PAS domain S-box protein [Magnetococcales bacterium]
MSWKKHLSLISSFFGGGLILTVLCSSVLAAETNKKPRLELTKFEQAWVDTKPTVRVRVGNVPPYHFMDKGRPSGISVELMDLIASLAGFKVKYISNISWPKALEHLKNQDGIIDLVLTAKKTKKREEFMAFSQKYLDLPWVIYSRQNDTSILGIDDLAGRTVAVERGYVMADKIRNNYPKIKLLLVDGVAPEALRAVSSAQADAYVGNLTVANYHIGHLGFSNLKIAAPTPFGSHTQSFGLRKDLTNLATILDSALEIITPEERTAMVQKYLSIRFEYGIQTKHLLLVVLAALGIIIFILYWVRVLKREIKARKKVEAELRDSEKWFQDFFNSSSSVMLLINPHSGEVLNGNRSAEKFYGYTQKQLASMNIAKINTLSPELIAQERQRALKEERNYFNFQHRLANGEIRDVAVYSNPVSNKNKSILLSVVHDITQRKQAEEKLRKSEENYKTLVETTSDWIWEMDTNATFKYASPAVKKILGYSPHDLIDKKTGFDLMPPKEAEKVRTKYNSFIASAKPFNNLVNINIHKDGHEVIMESSGRPFFDKTGEILGFRGIDRDITKRRRIENERLELGQKYQELFETMFSGFALHEIILDESGQPVDYRFLEVNKKFEEMTGLKASHVVGKTVLEVMPDLEKEWIHIYGKVALTGSTYSFENYSGDLDKHFEVVAYSNKKMQFVTVFQDVTKRKNAETLLIDAKEAAESANKAKSEFLAVMSHEIRTPLNAILGMTEVAKERNQDPDLFNCIEIIERSGNNLLSIISDILDLSHIEAGQLSLDNKLVNLKDLTQESIDIHTLNAKNKWLDLTSHISTDAPTHFTGDQKRLRQVLLNLLGNAVKFTDQGTIELRVSCPTLQKLQFSVSDSGIGIPEEKKKLIFEPFSQADASNTRQHGGVGLGLSICKRLVDAMSGEIWMESEAGKGSTFHFSVPLTDENQNTAQPSTSTSLNEKETSQTRLILLAEDNIDNSMVIEAYLAKSPHQLEIVENGAQAVEKIKSGRKYDIILMDIQMPVTDGLEATEQIRAWEREQGESKIPIFALTAHAMNGDEEKSIAAGCDSHITKPITKKKLLEIIDKFA